jgi:DNA helicase-2/ATP-dependent DNA helicase PcrA
VITKREDLTTDQKAIVDLSEGQHLVLAPPGTGKTELLAHRVEQALTKKITSDKMICLTFTNRAAKGMKERIEERYPKNNVFIGNIHQYCSIFLYKNKLISQYTSLIDEEDAVLLMEEAKTIKGYQYKDYIGDLLKLKSQSLPFFLP